jgi:hypothetical protein
MANILAPFGFRWAKELTGTAPNVQLTMRRISKSNATAIYHGDPVTSQSTGYIAQSVEGTTQINGIFVGCKYISVSQGRTVWMPYWPGSDAQSDPEAYVIDDPQAVFTVQANGGPIALADVQMNANFAIGTGNTYSGISGASLDASTVATTNTLPFRIIGYAGDGIFPAVGPGSDPTSAYNWVYVTFNNQDYKVLTGV